MILGKPSAGIGAASALHRRSRCHIGCGESLAKQVPSEQHAQSEPLACVRNTCSDCSDCVGAEARRLQLRRDTGEQLDISMTRVAQPYVSPIVTRTVNRDGKPVGLIRVKAFNARTRAEIADAVAGFQVRCFMCLPVV